MKRIFHIIISIYVFSNTFGQNIYTFAGNGNMGFSGDGGPGKSAQIFPFNVSTDAFGNVYILDAGNHRVRKVDPNGQITTIAGNGTSGNSGDGGAATSAQLVSPNGVAVDVSGNIYITDYINSNIRKVNVSGIISTIAGTGTAGFSGDGGLATLAQIYRPIGIAIDAASNIYFADCGNTRIRKIDASGIISTIAGTGTFGYSGDGGLATLAKLNSPYGVAIDGLYNIYISDFLNSRIRKINSSGIISTIAGTGINGYSGENAVATLAQINGPNSIALDLSGNIYFSESPNSRIRKINNLGIITTIAGNGINGYFGDNGLATSAQINGPSGVAIDFSNNVYFSDNNNYRVRVICASSCLAGIGSLSDKANIIRIFPNPNNGLFKIQIDNEIRNGDLVLMNCLGQKVYEHKIIQGENEINTNYLSKGLYNYVLLEGKHQIGNGKLAIE